MVCNHKEANYRPISLISSISKVLEKVVYLKLINFLDKYNILSDCQYGFCNNTPTETPILDLAHEITSNMENKLLLIGVFIDLSKAFDSLDSSIILSKLHHYGVRGSALNWFASYLKDRFWFVQLNDIKSKSLPMFGGVPQGSILGPVLFNIFINDVVFSSNMAKFILYADDTTILFKHSNINDFISNSNKELNVIYKWFLANNLRLNIKKTCFIIFGPKILTNQFHHSLSISNINIDKVESTKFKLSLSPIKSQKILEF